MSTAISRPSSGARPKGVPSWCATGSAAVRCSGCSAAPFSPFASEVAGLNALPFAARQLNDGYFAEVLSSLYCSDDETFWTDTRRVLPANVLAVGPNAARLTATGCRTLMRRPPRAR